MYCKFCIFLSVFPPSSPFPISPLLLYSSSPFFPLIHPPFSCLQFFPLPPPVPAPPLLSRLRSPLCLIPSSLCCLHLVDRKKDRKTAAETFTHTQMADMPANTKKICEHDVTRKKNCRCHDSDVEV